MANKGPSYGLSRQVQDKIDSKYDPELEQILVEWINRQCGSGVGRPEPGKLGFQAWLKDGCVSTNLHVLDSLLPSLKCSIYHHRNVDFGSGHCIYRQYNIICVHLKSRSSKEGRFKHHTDPFMSVVGV